MWIQIGNFVFLIESKRSDFDWVFLQDKDESKDIHLVTGPNKEPTVHNRTLKHLSCISKQVIEVLAENGKPVLSKHSKGALQASLPVRSSRDEYLRAAARQALFNMETLIHSHLSDTTWQGVSHRIFIPVIATNARLLSGTYSSSDIDNDARLAQIDLQPIPIAAFNHAEVLRCGIDYKEILSHIGWPAWGHQFRDDERYKGSHNKTVFIVHKDHLLDFIDQMMDIK